MLERLAPLEGKLAALEAGLAGQDPRAALDRFAERLEAVQGRLSRMESEENPFTEIAEQLTRLYAQKDAGIAAVLERLAPLEGKLAALEAGLAGQDPRAALDRFAERLEAVQGRLSRMESEENPFTEVAEQLTRLYAQKDAGVAAMLERLAPLEAGLGRIAPLEARLAVADQEEALDGLAARLEAVAWAQGELAAGLAALKAAGEGMDPFGRLAEQLTRLQAEKDAGLAAALERLAPLEARLAALEARPDPEAEPSLRPPAPAPGRPRTPRTRRRSRRWPPTSSRRSGPCRASSRCIASEAGAGPAGPGAAGQ